MKAIQRLVQYLDYKGIKPTRAEKDWGLSNGYLGTQLKRLADLGEGVLNKIIDNSLDLSIEWLLTGNGEMIKPKAPVLLEPKSSRHSLFDRKLPHQLIPLYDVTATASIVHLVPDIKPVPIDEIYIPNMPKCDGALPITGDSMYPLLKSGDIVLYKELKDINNVSWGEMYLVSISHNGDDFFFAKYVQQSDTPGYVRLVSQNAHHQPKEYPMESIRALAHIKAHIRYNSSY